MCNFFDDYDWEFLNDVLYDDEFEVEIEDYENPDSDDAMNQEDDLHDGFDIEDAYWSGIGLGWAYEERMRQRKNLKIKKLEDKKDIV